MNSDNDTIDEALIRHYLGEGATIWASDAVPRDAVVDWLTNDPGELLEAAKKVIAARVGAAVGASAPVKLAILLTESAHASLAVQDLEEVRRDGPAVDVVVDGAAPAPPR